LDKNDTFFVQHTVDGRNPAPPGMYNTLLKIRYPGAGFPPSTVSTILFGDQDGLSFLDSCLGSRPPMDEVVS